MSQVPDELYYSEDHEWVAFDADTNIATIGITDYAQGELGDVVFLELPEIGMQVTPKDTCGTIEAVKTVAELYAPVSGEIIEINADLEDRPETVNRDPYGDGWILKIQVADAGELDTLLDATAYRTHIG